jgi:hypothetical protein
MKSKLLTTLIVATIASIGANAATITLDGSTDGASTFRSSGNTAATLTGFDATASDKLVVVAGAPRASGTFTLGITSITYNGVEMNLATRGVRSGSDRATGIFYLDSGDFSGAGDIVVSFDTQIFSEGYDIGAFALSGTALGFDSGASNDGSSATTTVGQSGSFVAAVNLYGANPTGTLTSLGSDNLARGYELAVDAGSYTATFSGGNITSVASFAPIPEPSSALLISLVAVSG